MVLSVKDELFRDCAQLASRYNWPLQAADLREHKLPVGFGLEIGKAIGAFKNRFPFYNWASECHDNAVARELVKFRVLYSSLCRKVRQDG